MEKLIIQKKNLLHCFYQKSEYYTDEMKSTFNSIDMAMIRFENNEAKYVNKAILELLKNTLPCELLNEMLKHESNGAEDSKKLNQLVQSFIEYKIFRIYNSPQQLQDIE